MLTKELAHETISRRQNPDVFDHVWFKLTQLDIGSHSRYIDPEVSAEALLWQDPVPAVDHELVNNSEIAALKEKILATGPVDRRTSIYALASAATLRLRHARWCQR